MARTAYKNADTGKPEFKAVERKFEDENPILAREAAFTFRNEFIYGMLTAIGLSDEEIGWNNSERKIERLSEREIRKLINGYLEPENESVKTTLRLDDNEETEIEWTPPDDTLSWYSSFTNGIWIILIHNDIELHEKCYGDDNLVIDKVSRYEEPLPTPPNYLNLQEEYQFYKKNKFDTKTYETSIVFFDDELFLEGGYREVGESENEAEERSKEESLKVIEYLKTPFDWTGYDKIYWWDKEKNKNPSNKVEGQKLEPALTITMEEALNGEENQFCEFKPGLINWKSSSRDMEYEVVKAICAFLNAEGGYIFIGKSDDGEVVGLNFSNISKDVFRREFTRIKTRFLPPFIAHSIYGKFIPLEGKEIFAITIYPSLSEPIFLRRKDENNKLVSKEFYVRSDAASRHIYDIEEIVKYCRTRAHWNL